ncbi:MAG: hypothetical protein K9L28_01940 [Synergistales bacterium]|nr:hypothetical protein [Synergistales bacterium]
MTTAVLGALFALMVLLVGFFGRAGETWLKVVVFGSLSIKGSLLLLVWGQLAGRPGVTLPALAILLFGDLGVAVLALFLERGHTG